MKYLSITIIIIFLAPMAYSQSFKRVESKAGINHKYVDEYFMGGGAAFFDFNNDGHIDIYITGGEEKDKLYKNNGDGTFDDVSDAAGLGFTDTIKTNGVCTGDIDNDGDRDIFVTTNEEAPNILLKNNNNGTFTNVALASGITDTSWSMSVSMGDYNQDGYLDIYVGNYVTIIGGNPEAPFYNRTLKSEANYLYVNNGDGTFSNKALNLNANNSGATLAVAFTDYDGDGDMDIYVANDFGFEFGANAMLRNNYPLNTFTDVALATKTDAEIHAMGIAIGDFNRDEDLDYYISNMGENIFYENKGRYFEDIAKSNKTECVDYVSWGTFFFDYNHDAMLDLYVANGHVNRIGPIKEQANTLYTGQRSSLFKEDMKYTGSLDTAITRGAIYGDYDNDGDLDIFVVNINDTITVNYNSFLIRNNSKNDNNWLKVKTEGATNNYDGYGSLITLYTGGKTFIQEIGGGSSYLSQNSSIANFGLNKSDMVDSASVTWIGGEVQMMFDIPANQMLHIKEGNQYRFITEEICAGDSIMFGNNWISTPGTYKDTIKLLKSDSIIAFTLSYTDSLYKEENVTIMDGDSIYLEGAYQTKAGSYTDVKTTKTGCVITKVTNLTIDFSNGFFEKELKDWIIFPNPSNGQFTIVNQKGMKGEVEVKLLDITSKIIMQTTIPSGEEKIELDIRNYSNGIYYLHIVNKKKEVVRKILKN